MRFSASSKTGWLWAFCACMVLLAVSGGVAQAQWSVSVAQVVPDPYVDEVYTYTSGTGTASAAADNIWPSTYVTQNYAETDASASPGYNGGQGHAYIKSRMDFTWSGGGTPTTWTIKYRKSWGVTPVGSNGVGYNATPSFDGVQVTVATGNSGWTNYNVTTPGSVNFAPGSVSSVGYSYGGTTGSRSADAYYEWDFGP